MGREIEIKIPLTSCQYQDLLEFVKGKKLIDGISLSGNLIKLHKKDEYYSRFNSREERKSSGEPQVLRIRSEYDGQNQKSYITIKRKKIENGIELNIEDETFVENAEVIRELFELSDYHCWFKKEKESYSIHSTSKVLPDIDFHLEIIKVNELPYVEVEVTDSTVDADKVKKAIADYMILLSLDPNKKDTRSWVEIVESQNNTSSKGILRSSP